MSYLKFLILALWTVGSLICVPLGCAGESQDVDGEDDDNDDDDDDDDGTTTVRLTYYWIAFESDFSGAKDTDLETCEGQHLATVAYDFATSIRMEGTGRLEDGRTLNLGGCDCGDGFSCFMEIGDWAPWGIGSHNNPLEPFVSVAVDQDIYEFGTVFYSPDLDGVEYTKPDGESEVHDGCIRADDVGWSFEGYQVDWFVVHESNHWDLDEGIPESIRVEPHASACSHLK